MVAFGYNLTKPRSISLDDSDMRKCEALLAECPELSTCLGCGGCSATCSAAQYSAFNPRMIQTLLRRGEYDAAYDMIDMCMLCGKCRMVCPRGINTRRMIVSIKRILSQM